MKKYIIIIIAIIVLVLAAIGGYWYWSSFSKSQTQEATTSNGSEGTNENQVLPGVDAEFKTSGEGILTVCVDECGNGVCQSAPKCADNESCVCQETKEVCPEDCK